MRPFFSSNPNNFHSVSEFDYPISHFDIDSLSLKMDQATSPFPEPPQQSNIFSSLGREGYPPAVARKQVWKSLKIERQHPLEGAAGHPVRVSGQNFFASGTGGG
jgi:hypothetical protein